MPRKYLRKYIPKPNTFKDHESLERVKHLLEEPNLWHLNRHSVSRGCLIGMFMAMIPLPMQMLGAAILSIFFRANLPIAVALTWVTNPFTTPFVLYISYKVGAFILGQNSSVQLNLSWEAIEHDLAIIGPSLMTGILVNAVVLSVASYYLVRGIWWLYIVMKFRERKRRYINH
jgi:uncharacterized protein (DUF2062 family)